MALVQSLITIVLFFAILGTLVVIHELGHFVTARMANVRVLEFGLGFPPRAKVLRNKGETLYTLNWLPIGGFVRLEGEDGDEADDPRSFSAQRWVTKLVILVAGVVMNIVLAFAIFMGIALIGDPTIGVRVGRRPAGFARRRRSGSSPATRSSASNGGYFGAFDDVRLLDQLQDHAGETVTLGIQKADGTFETLTVTLRDAAAVAAGQGALGISGAERGGHGRVDQLHRWPKPSRSVRSARWRRSGSSSPVSATLVDSIVTDPTQAPPVAGPVGIATQIGDIFWQLGPILTLYVAGILSANLAVVNILPFPPLDGGRMLMITLKRVFGARDQPARRAADLHRRLRLPVRLPDLDHGLRHHPEPRRRDHDLAGARSGRADARP